MTDEHMTAEMIAAKAFRDQGAELRKAAEREFAEARTLRDQAARDRRDVAEAEARSQGASSGSPNSTRPSSLPARKPSPKN